MQTVLYLALHFRSHLPGCLFLKNTLSSTLKLGGVWFVVFWACLNWFSSRVFLGMASPRQCNSRYRHPELESPRNCCIGSSNWWSGKIGSLPQNRKTRLYSLCVACRVFVYACMVLCAGSSLDLGAGWSVMVRCCSLSVSCNSSSVGVHWGVLGFKLSNWFLSCWNCSSKSAKGKQVSVSSQNSSDESLSPSSTGWSCGMRSKGAGSWVSRMSSVSWPSCHAVCLVACSKGV